MQSALDHVAIACIDLAAARDWLEGLLGVPMSPRGEHTRMGTHNHLVSLGPERYLELIAIDPAATAPTHPRWFDLDHFSGPTRLTNWILRCDNLEAALALAPQGAGEPLSMSRGAYRWQMAVPADGKLPFDGLFPALIQWHGEQPAPALPDHGLRLTGLTLTHPRAADLDRALAPFDTPLVRVQQGPAPRMSATLDTPKGPLTL